MSCTLLILRRSSNCVDRSKPAASERHGNTRRVRHPPMLQVGDFLAPFTVGKNMVSPSAQELPVLLAGSYKQADLVAVSPPQSKRLRQALGRQRQAKHGQAFARFSGLAFEILRRAELNGHYTLAAAAQLQYFIHGCVFFTAAVLDLASGWQNTGVWIEKNHAAIGRHVQAVLKPSFSAL